MAVTVPEYVACHVRPGPMRPCPLQILLMLHMLHEAPWRYFPLTLQYLQPEYAALIKGGSCPVLRVCRVAKHWSLWVERRSGQVGGRGPGDV